MSSAFSTRDTQLSRAIEAEFGELFEFSGRKLAAADVNLPRVADGTKPAFQCVGLWEGLGKSLFIREQRGDESALRRSTQYCNVLVSVDWLVWMPQAGTICKRLHDLSEYEVAQALPDDMGAVLFVLSNKK